VWRSLNYGVRLALSFGLIVIGLAVQYVTENFLAGVAPLVAGNLLLLVTGYDNRVDFGSFEHDTSWEGVELDRLENLQDLDKKIRKWDSSALDVTSPLGAFFGIALAAGLGIAAWASDGFLQVFLLDALVLLIPHWVTGVRSILRKPKLMVRVDMIRSVLGAAEAELEPHQVDLMMLLRGGEGPEGVKLPEDVKFKVDPADHHEDFLGLYGQVVINDVNGHSYPYFYVVLVGREGYGLEQAEAEYQTPAGLTSEFKRQDNVEVFVLRQTTTRTSGYHTPAPVASGLFLTGLQLAGHLAVGPRTTA
jgi:hypothetical protein